jgi:hypothetical protein
LNIENEPKGIENGPRSRENPLLHKGRTLSIEKGLIEEKNTPAQQIEPVEAISGLSPAHDTIRWRIQAQEGISSEDTRTTYQWSRH